MKDLNKMENKMENKLNTANARLNIFIREWVLVLAMFLVFPVKSVKIVAYKWHLWIQKWESIINKDHEDYFNSK